MVARRALSSAGCGHCRSSVLRLFAAPATTAPVSRAALLTARPIAFPTSAPAGDHRRQYSSSASDNPSSTQPAQHQQQQSDQKTTTPTQDEADELDANEDSAANDTPWYLQVEPPRHVAQLEPEPLPEVPEGAPPIIEALLKYAAEDMGLHDISLLDLRELDPPAALGPNLFMLFGSARSERHLVVTAGRLQRWLRYTHRIYADADGLLGPNERKTRLRRKAKRAKLLGTMGTDDADDGLKTGWICVNLGTVNRSGANDGGAVYGSDGRVAGFGVTDFGSSVVFQVMTEEQRAEMNLEGLWKRALKPYSKPEPESGSQSEPHVIRAGNSSYSAIDAMNKAIPSDAPSRPSPRQKGKFTSPYGPASFFSTTRSVRATADAAPLDPLQTNLSDLMQSDASSKWRVLDLLRARLDLCAPDQIREALGHTPSGQITTPFLQLFSEAAQFLPSSKTWAYRLAMLSKARQAQHPGSLEVFGEAKALVDEMRLQAIDATREQYMQLLTCAHSLDSPQATRLTLDILDTMHQRGQHVVAWDIFVTLMENTKVDQHRNHLDVAHSLMTLAREKKLPCPDESIVKRLMSMHQGSLLWAMRLPSMYGRERSPALYQHFLECAANRASPRLCGVVARTAFRWMGAERPQAVIEGDVLHALIKCIRIADPNAERTVHEAGPNDKPLVQRAVKADMPNLVQTLKREGYKW